MKAVHRGSETGKTIDRGKHMMVKNAIGTKFKIASKGILKRAAVLIAAAGLITGCADANSGQSEAASTAAAVQQADSSSAVEISETEQPSSDSRISTEEMEVLKKLYEASQKEDEKEIAEIVNNNFYLLYDLETTTLDNQLLLFDGTGFSEDGAGTGLIMRTRSWDARFSECPNSVEYRFAAYWGTFDEFNANGEVFSYSARIRDDQDQNRMLIDFTKASYVNNKTNGLLSTSEYKMDPAFEKILDFTSEYDEDYEYEFLAPITVHVKAEELDMEDSADTEGYVTFSNLDYHPETESETDRIATTDDGRGTIEFAMLESLFNHVIYENQPGTHKENKAASVEEVDLEALWTEEQQKNFTCLLNGFQYENALNDLCWIAEGHKGTEQKKIENAFWFAVYWGFLQDKSQFENSAYIFGKDEFETALKEMLGYDCSSYIETFLSPDGQHYVFEIEADLGDEGPFAEIRESIPTDYGLEIHTDAGYMTGETIDESYELDYYLYYNGASAEYPFRLRYLKTKGK